MTSPYSQIEEALREENHKLKEFMGLYTGFDVNDPKLNAARYDGYLDGVQVGMESQGHLTSGWRSIDSAPKDGARILVYEPDTFTPQYRIHIVDWRDSGWACDEVIDWLDPTHWMPLPAPPTEPSAKHVNDGGEG